MMSMLDIRRAVLGSQPAAVNRLARSLLAAFLREAGTDGNWKAVARRHFETMAASALAEECALGEKGAMAFVAAVLRPVAGLAAVYRGAGETDLADLADIAAGFGTGRPETDALRHAAGHARDAALRVLPQSGASPVGSAPRTSADREAKAALRRLYSVAAPGLRLGLAVDASRWIAAQAAGLPLQTLARTPYEEMLPREMDLLEGLVSGYIEEAWFRDMRYRDLFAAVPAEFLAFLAPAIGGEDRGDRLLRILGHALLVPSLERLDLLGDAGGSGAERAVAETGRRLADWTEKVLSADPPADVAQPRRSCLERLRARHATGIEALLNELRGRCADAARQA